MREIIVKPVHWVPRYQVDVDLSADMFAKSGLIVTGGCELCVKTSTSEKFCWMRSALGMTAESTFPKLHELLGQN